MFLKSLDSYKNHCSLPFICDQSTVKVKYYTSKKSKIYLYYEIKLTSHIYSFCSEISSNENNKTRLLILSFNLKPCEIAGKSEFLVFGREIHIFLKEYIVWIFYSIYKEQSTYHGKLSNLSFNILIDRMRSCTLQYCNAIKM